MIDGQTSIFDNDPNIKEIKVEEKRNVVNGSKKKKLNLNDEEKEFIINFLNYYSSNLIKWHVSEENQDTVRDFINNIKLKLGDRFLNRLNVEVNNDVNNVKELIKDFYK